MEPLIAIVGCASDVRKDELKLTDPATARQAAEQIGRELAKAKCRLLVYSTDPNFIEADVVRGYVASKCGFPSCIEVRYPLGGSQPQLSGIEGHDELFDWRPTQSADWEVAFYRSVQEAEGMILIGGGYSTLVGGLVAMGHRIPIVALAAFGGNAAKVWESMSPEHDLASREEISMMARPKWTEDSAKRCVDAVLAQRERQQRERERRAFEELRRSGMMSRQAVMAMLLFLLALAAVPVAWAESSSIHYRGLLWLVFFAPVLGGVSGATIRRVFDWQQGQPSTSQSTWITAALGLVAGGVSGLLFISAQLSAVPVEGNEVMFRLQEEQASRLVPFALAIGFTAGLTLDAVFRKLTGLDVLRSEALEEKKP